MQAAKVAPSRAHAKEAPVSLAEKANVAVDPDDLWVKACFVDMGPTKNRRRVRPAPQGRAYREQRHFHHVTILLSSDEREDAKTGNGRGRKTSKAGKPQTAGKPGKSAKAAAAGDKTGTKRASKKAAQPEETKATDTPTGAAAPGTETERAAE